MILAELCNRLRSWLPFLVVPIASTCSDPVTCSHQTSQEDKLAPLAETHTHTTGAAAHHNMILARLCNRSRAWFQLPIEELIEGVEGLQGVCNVICVQLSAKGL